MAVKALGSCLTGQVWQNFHLGNLGLPGEREAGSKHIMAK